MKDCQWLCRQFNRITHWPSRSDAHTTSRCCRSCRAGLRVFGDAWAWNAAIDNNSNGAHRIRNELAMEHSSNDNSIARARTLSLSLYLSVPSHSLSVSPQEHSLQQAQRRIVSMAARGSEEGGNTTSTIFLDKQAHKSLTPVPSLLETSSHALHSCGISAQTCTMTEHHLHIKL